MSKSKDLREPDDTQKEVALVFGCCNQAISQAYRRLGITRKKTLSYKEPDSEKVEKYMEEIKDILKEKIAYVDETGINSCLCR